MTLQWPNFPKKGQPDPNWNRPHLPEEGWFGPGGRGVPGQPRSTPAFGPDSPFFEGFETDPQGQQANFLGRFAPNLSRGQFATAQSLLPSTLGRYKQQAGAEVLSGGMQPGSFSEFLDRFNFGRELRRQQPGQQRFVSSPTTFRY